MAKSTSLSVLISLIIGGGWLFSDIYTPNHYKKYSYNLWADVNHSFVQLDETSNAFRQGSISLDSLQNTLSKARETYKKSEFLLSFYFPEYVNENINGAPLLGTEVENSKPLLNEPQGLQVLDELIYSDEAESARNEIANLTRRLKNSYAILFAKLNALQVSEDYAVLAMRVQLVRIFSLSVTGFDTPGSLNGINEAIASLSGMKTYLQTENLFKNTKKRNEIIPLFDNAIQYLQNNNNFERLDRLTLLTDYIDPLYKALGKAHPVKPDEYLQNITSWNPESESIFDADFLNPYFYTELSRDEDSEQLKSLGEKLFYDTALSDTGTMSCASCHHPDKAFSDGMAKSPSKVHGQTVMRNSPTLLNAVYSDRYFYDLRAFSLEQQIEHVIFNESEFSTSYQQILKKINTNKEYQTIFNDLYGKTSVNRDQLSKALASYVLSLRSFDSEFDRYVRREQLSISEDIRNGFNLFMGKANCATCHFAPTFSGLVPPLFTDSESEILGVMTRHQSNQLDDDKGRYDNGVSTENLWIYEKSFKTTTVRNIEITAPYFHNGAYSTLEEVVDFYDTGGGEGVGLNVRNQTLAADQLFLTDKEKSDIITFMKALTDYQYKK